MEEEQAKVTELEKQRQKSARSWWGQICLDRIKTERRLIRSENNEAEKATRQAAASELKVEKKRKRDEHNIEVSASLQDDAIYYQHPISGGVV